MSYENHKYNNCAILVKDKEHGKKVIEWWKKQGVYTRGYTGCEINWYYGLFDGLFDYDLSLPEGVKIIELPQEDVYPKLMWVSDRADFSDKIKRVVFMKKCNIYLAWHRAESFEGAEETTNVTTWKYAKDVEEEQIVELTIEDISNGKGVGIAPHLIRIKK